MGDTIEKVSIIISKGSLEGIYPGLIMANGARAEGHRRQPVLHVLRPRRHPQGPPRAHQARHRRQPRPAPAHPGSAASPACRPMMTRYMNHKMEELDIPSIPEFIEMIADTGAGLYACKASVDLFGLEKNDFIAQVARHHHRRRVLRDGRRRPDHLHLTPSARGERPPAPRARRWVGAPPLPSPSTRDTRSRTMIGKASTQTGGPSLPIGLVGDDVLVPCGDGRERHYVNLDSAASTKACPPWHEPCTSLCRGTRV